MFVNGIQLFSYMHGLINDGRRGVVYLKYPDGISIL